MSSAVARSSGPKTQFQGALRIGTSMHCVLLTQVLSGIVRIAFFR